MSTTPELRAERLLRWYPEAWRDRYGEEFAELLVAEIDERPASWRRTANVALSGTTARLSLTGLGAGPGAEPVAMLATVGGIIAGFTILGLSVWSQLVAGTAARSGGTAAHVGLLGLTAALAFLGVIMIAAVVPVVLPVVRGACTRSEVRRPLAVMAVSATALVAGGLHLASHWPARGSGLASRLASFGWAESWSVNTAWAHPTALPLMHPARLGWMLASPVALATLVVAGAMVLRRVDLSARTLRHELRMATAAVVGMVSMILAAGAWVLTSQHNANPNLRAGTLDVALLAVMAVAVVMTGSVTGRLRRISTAS